MNQFSYQSLLGISSVNLTDITAGSITDSGLQGNNLVYSDSNSTLQSASVVSPLYFSTGALSFNNSGTLTVGNLIDNGLTGNELIYAATGTHQLTSATTSSNLTFSGGVLNTAQGIQTTSSPTFDNLTLNGTLSVSSSTFTNLTVSNTLTGEGTVEMVNLAPYSVNTKINVSTSLVPTIDNTDSLGSTSFAWNTLYVNNIKSVGSIAFNNQLLVEGNILPSVSGVDNLGSSSFTWNNAYIDALYCGDIYVPTITGSLVYANSSNHGLVAASVSSPLMFSGSTLSISSSPTFVNTTLSGGLILNDNSGNTVELSAAGIDVGSSYALTLPAGPIPQSGGSIIASDISGQLYFTPLASNLQFDEPSNTLDTIQNIQTTSSPSFVGVYTNGDAGGVASTVCLTNVVNNTQGVGVDTIKSTSVSNNSNAGFLKAYLGTTTIYLPYWTSI